MGTRVKELWWPYLFVAVVGFKRFSLKVEPSFESLRLSNKSLELPLLFLDKLSFKVERFFFVIFTLED